MDGQLNDKQEQFCQEYAIDRNGTRAAIRAGYSENCPGQIAYDLLKKTEIRNRISEIESDYLERIGVNKLKVLSELKKIAFSDMRKFSNWGPNGVILNDSSSLDDESASCVSEVSESQNEFGKSLKFKLHDKKGALQMLGNYLGLWTEKVDHTTNGAPIQSMPVIQVVDPKAADLTQKLLNEQQQ